ncbi:MAG: (2Fe-2S)-binding protein [Candidatus Hadarchaeum sp.]|uniref:(2Fe-2S)-binding protein n=1 Tax=Candidatus Hadarchaeum sp. TaxID=2883567 RepID=UPI0031751C66
MVKHCISLKVNGESYSVEIEANRTLLQLLREDLGLTGTKQACERGDCGLCTVLVNGVPMKSCLVLAVEADGKEITTIEGIARGEKLSRVQRAFVEHGAVQCGFCTPAFILTAEAFLRRNPNPSEEEVKEAIGGLLCRCTGYRQIIDAILDAAKRSQD